MHGKEELRPGGPISKRELLLLDIRRLYSKANESYEKWDGIKDMQSILGRGLARLRAEVRDFRDDAVETYFEALELYLKGIYQLKLARDLVAKVEQSGSPHHLKYESLKGAVEGPLKKARGCLCDSSLSGSMRRELEGRYGALHTTVVLYLHELERLADGKPRIYTLPSSLGRRKTEGVGLR